jgi:hypothetical protein
LINSEESEVCVAERQRERDGERAYHMEELSRLIGWQSPTRDNIIKELTPSDVLHDDEDVRWRVDHFISAEQRGDRGQISV